jgi:Peptidase family C25
MGKVILTNRTALHNKYGTRSPRIDAAVKALIQSDLRKGIVTKLIALDSPTAMRDFGPVVKDPKSMRQNKKAVDAIYKALSPDYILLLGATDVIPHQDLKNPAYRKGFDDDDVIPSDLPYASEGGWGTDPTDFTAVTRVVGRLPDVSGTKDPTYLIKLINSASKATALPPGDFREYFGITAEVWKTSTELSLEAIFGSASDLQQIPPRGYRWSSGLLGRRAHFINCHGAPSSWQFYGQPKGVQQFPVAQDGRYIPRKVKRGTVVAAECCYGAQLYDPTPTGAKSPGLCNVYLGNGAYGFFGSSTIAYGPESSNDWADHICQYFWREILQGSSLGSAVLRARQGYVKERSKLDPIDQKTLAQFNLLGDPSIHPVKVPVADQPVAHTKTVGRANVHALSLAAGRTERRRSMFMAGIAISEATAVAVRTTNHPVGGVSATLKSLAKKAQIDKPEVISYDIGQPARGLGVAAVHSMRVASPSRERIHLVMGRSRSDRAPMPQIIAIVAKEENGKIVNYRTGYSR